jgi:hypothetical protein
MVITLPELNRSDSGADSIVWMEEVDNIGLSGSEMIFYRFRAVFGITGPVFFVQGFFSAFLPKG